MKKIFLILAFLALMNIALAANFSIEVEPRIVNASHSVILRFNITNLDSMNNITTLNISFPSGFDYSFSSPSTGTCSPIASSLLKCSGSPLIENNTLFNINITFQVNVEDIGNYTFNFSALDSSNVVASNSTNVTVQDVDSPTIISISPANNTNYVYSPKVVYYFNISVSDNIKVNSTEFFFGGELKDINYTKLKGGSITFQINDLPVGEYNFSFRVNDTSGNSNSSGFYFFNISSAPNLIDVYLNGTKNQNITIVNGSSINITAVSKGNISLFLNDILLIVPLPQDRASTDRIFDQVGLYKIFANSTGNQNYTSNSTGVEYWVKVIYPRITYSNLQAPSSETYSPSKTYEFKVTFSSPAYPLNNITNVSFTFNDSVYYLSISNPQNQTFSFTVKDLKSGDYSWKYCAIDSQQETVCVSGTLSVAKATPNLQILNAQDYVAPVNKTIIGLNCPEQLVCEFFLNDTKLSSNYYNLVTDESGYYIFTYNTSGNENYTSFEVKKEIRVYSPIATTTTTQPQNISTQEPQNISAPSSEIKLIDFSPSKINIVNIENEATLKFKQIIVNVSDEEKNVKFEVRAPLQLPEKQPPGIPFSFIEINTNLSANKINSLRFSFRVEKIWISSNQIDENTISLYRWNGNEWEKLETRKISEDNDNIYFEAYSNKFSIFAISGEKKKESFPIFSILILIVGIIVVAIVLYLFWPTQTKSEYEKLKEKLSSRALF